MSAPTGESLCQFCNTMVDNRGRHGHVRSIVHTDNGGPVDVDLSFLPNPDAARVANLSDQTGLAEAAIADVLAENEELRRRLAESEQANAKLRPFVEQQPLTTAAEVMEFYGEAHMRHLAEVRLAVTNKQRAKEGLPPLYSDKAAYAELVADEIRKAAVDMAGDAGRWVSARALARGEHTKLRVLKMAIPAQAPQHQCEDTNAEGFCYTHAGSWQLPLEPQINNGAGSLNDPIERYKRKGHKLMTPLRCHLVDCWTPSAVSPAGELLFRGYCSQLHHDYIEGRISHNDSAPALIAQMG